MSRAYAVTVAVVVTDRAALFAAALKQAVEVDGMEEDDARKLLTEEPDEYAEEDADGINVEACLQMIFDPGISPDGCEIAEATAEALPDLDDF